MGLEMYTVRVQCFGGGVTSPPCLQAVFVMERLSMGRQLVNAR